MLGADIEVNARRLFTKAEKVEASKVFPKGTLSIEQIEMYSMAYNGKKSRLINVMVLDENYPLIPGLRLKSQGLVKKDLRKKLNDNILWASPELVIQLQSQIGSAIQIGEHSFKIDDVIEEDEDTWQMDRRK